VTWENAVVAREDEVLSRIEEEIRLLREEHHLLREEHREHVRAYRELADDSHEFTREMVLRVQRSGIAQVRALDDLRDQVRANTRAVLSVLDRLGRGGAAA
jgi:hypothetical protein